MPKTRHPESSGSHHGSFGAGFERPVCPSCKSVYGAYPSLKRRAADRRVRKYTAMAAANGLNPVVGMDAVIDARILKEMYQGIRTDFGLGKWDLPIEGNRVNLVKKWPVGLQASA